MIKIVTQSIGKREGDTFFYFAVILHSWKHLQQNGALTYTKYKNAEMGAGTAIYQKE